MLDNSKTNFGTYHLWARLFRLSRKSWTQNQGQLGEIGPFHKAIFEIFQFNFEKSDFGQIRLVQLVNRKHSSSSQQSIVGSRGRLWLDQVSTVREQKSFPRKTLKKLPLCIRKPQTLVRLGQHSQSIEKLFTKDSGQVRSVQVSSTFTKILTTSETGPFFL